MRAIHAGRQFSFCSGVRAFGGVELAAYSSWMNARQHRGSYVKEQ